VRYRKAWMALLLLAVLSPLGLLAVGAAWGEWDLDSIYEAVGFRPQGMERLVHGTPEPPIPDYEIPGLPEGEFGTSIGLVLSALIGAGITVGVTLLASRVIRHGKVS
jgi:cobalt/nickel transport protein